MSDHITRYDFDLGERVKFVITKWCKSITDDGKDYYTKRQVPEDCIYKFRILDDDQVIYGYGYASDSSSFAPVNYYRGSYGCEHIEYKEEDGWQAL